MSNFVMLQNQYGLLHNLASPVEATQLAQTMSQTSHKQEWLQKREQYYSQTGDINAQIVEILENV